MGQPVASASLELTANEVKLVKALDKAEKRLDRYKSRTKSRLKTVSRSFNSFKAVAVGALSALAVKEIYQAGIAMQGLERAFSAAAGSASAGKREFNFVREEAHRLGLELETSATAYAKLTAAAQGTSLQGKDAREIFVAVAEASRVMSLSVDQTNGALTAIEQIISKGKVSAEELRGQLGERLPGAFQIAARSIGVTTAELDDMLKAGELTAERLLPAMARELRNTFGSEVENAANDAQAAYNRFGNAMFELKTDIAESGVLDAITALATKTTEIINKLGPILGQFGWGDEANILAGNVRKATREIEKIEEKIVELREEYADEADDFFVNEEKLKRINEEIAVQNELLMGQQNWLVALKQKQDALNDSQASSGGVTGGGTAEEGFDLEKHRAALQARSEVSIQAMQAEAEAELAIKRKLEEDLIAGRATTDEAMLEMAKAAAAGKVLAEHEAEMEAREALGLPMSEEEEIEYKKELMQRMGDETNSILRDIVNEKVRIEAEASKKAIDAAADEAEKKKKFQDTMLGGVKQFIGKNKVLMAAARAAENRERIKEAWASTHAGATKALEWGWPLGPIFAAAIYALGVSNIASMAGLGLGGGGGGGGGGGISSAPSTSGGTTSAPAGSEDVTQRKSESMVTVNIAGNLHADEEYLWNQVIPGIQEAVKEKDVVFIDADSRQAEELALA